MAQNTITIDSSVLESIARYRKVLEASRIPVQKMIVFGSHAKGRARHGSDIDVAVVSTLFGRDDVEEMQELWKKTHLADLRIEPYPLSPEDFASGSSPIVAEIREHGVVV